MPAIVDYAPFFHAAAAAVRERESARSSARTAPKRKSDACAGSSAASRQRVPGDARLRAVRAQLDGFSIERSPPQRDFHDAFLMSCLPWIYGIDDFERHRDRICDENGIDRVRSETMVCAPRRFGKTTSVAIYCASMLLHVPGVWISVYSTGKRASSGLAEATRKYIAELDGQTDRIVKCNQEELFLRPAGGGGDNLISRMFSYPSSVQGLKGTGGQIIILEEASRLDDAVFSEVVAPLLGIEHTALLAISTPLGEDNRYSQLLSMTHPSTGEPVFNTIEISLCCADCKKRGVVGECPHRKHLIPSWKSAERSELVKHLMGTQNSAMYLREQMGIVTGSDTLAFDVKAIDRFVSKRFSTRFVFQPKQIFCAIDPNGGGASEMAICSGYFMPNGSLAVLSTDAYPCSTDAELEAALAKHIQTMRDMPRFRNAELIAITESNFGGWVFASRIAAIVEIETGGHCAHLTLDPSGRKRPGIIAKSETKERMRAELQRMLRNDTIFIDADFRSIRGATEMKGELEAQLRNYKYEIRAPTDPAFGRIRKALTGKTGGKQDDAVITLQMLAFFPTYFFENRTTYTVRQFS